jgi:Flp pilus assembly protein TadG
MNGKLMSRFAGKTITTRPRNHRIGSPARKEKRGNRSERGTEMLEFAFVISLLMMLFLGIVTFARAFNIYQSITRAAREGARVAVLPSCASCGNAYLDPSTGVTQANSAVFSNYIAPVLEDANLNPNDVLNYSESVGWLDSGDTAEQCGVTISFQYPYQLDLPFTAQNLSTIDIRTRVQMRQENQPVGGTCP